MFQCFIKLSLHINFYILIKIHIHTHSLNLMSSLVCVQIVPLGQPSLFSGLQLQPADLSSNLSH